jgi:hypothetical protein
MPQINPMHITSQLAVFLANKPGTLAALCRTLSKAKINIYAIATSDSVDHNVVRLIVDEPRRALRLIEEHGALVVATDVLMIEGNNRPGSLAEIAETLAQAKINIEYAYCATAPNSSRGLLILRPSHVANALKALNKSGKVANPS